MSIIFVLAVWGAVLSTLLATLEILKYRKDKPNIIVNIKGGYKFYPVDHPYNPYGNSTLLVISASNRGKRPITLTKAALLMPRGSKGRHLMCTDLSPIELTEGKSHDYYIKEEILKTQYSLSPQKYVAFVVDATGRFYWSHNFLIRFLKLHRIK